MQTIKHSRVGLWALGLLLALCAAFALVPAAHADNDGLVGADIRDGVLKGYYGNEGDIVIPNTVTKIDDEAFKKKDVITSVTIPGSVNEIRPYAFAECPNLKAIYFPDSKIGAKMIIRVGAFEDCPKLEECIIPACAEYVTGNVFKGCTSMEKIQVDPDNPYYYTDEYGVLFGPWVDEGVPQYDDPNNALIGYPCGRAPGGYTIPGEVKGHHINQIWASSFRNARNLTSIEIPASCEILRGNGFENTGLTELTIPSTVKFAGAGLVAHCENLTDVTINAPINTLEMSFFDGCTSLQRIKFPDTISSFGMYAFRKCSSLTSIRLPSQMSTLDSDLFGGCTNLQRVFVPASIVNFPSVDQYLLNPFEGTSGNLMVYVVKGSTGERWATNHAEEFGWTYQVVSDPQQLTSMDVGTFSLVDMGKKVKLSGAFHFDDTMRVENVTNGPVYDAFKNSTEGAVRVYQISMANGAAAPENMTLGVARPAGMTSNAKLYTLKDGQVTLLNFNVVSGTMNAKINTLGYFAVIDGTVSGGEVDPTVPTNVQLNRTAASLEVGKKLQLNATVTPDTAADKSVTWKSSAPAIARVDGRGAVEGVSAGTATITATTVNGLTASCKVTVTGGSTPTPVPPAPSEKITAAAALRAGNALTPKGDAPFTLSFSNAERIATVEVQFEATGSAVQVLGQNGFTLLGDVSGRQNGGKFVGSAMLCYLSGDRTLFSSQKESAIAQFAVTGEKPSFKVTGIKISGWNSQNEVAYGTVTGIDPSEDTFTGSLSYDLNKDGIVDQLDITWAQQYYRAESGDNNWNEAMCCDFNGDSVIDIADFIDILNHFTV